MVPPGPEPGNGVEASPAWSLWPEQPGEGKCWAWLSEGRWGFLPDSPEDPCGGTGLCALRPKSKGEFSTVGLMGPMAGVLGLVKRTQRAQIEKTGQPSS